MTIGDCTERCHAVKNILHEITESGGDFIPAPFLVPAPDKYARRLVHRDPAMRYSMVAMVWGPGQGTPLHDHDGHWCVECVYRGRIKVVSYSPVGDLDAGVVQFKPEKQVMAGVADAGALIPPFDYHTIENADQTPSVTLHVYSEELTQCAIFVPTEGGYRREVRQLCYTS
ncbi:MAG TPA: cysteine dioxygenase family protein [Fimbriimonadaceae bacterium]|nr:cysteine dioxygenase family protein [Fimbriimonadaceae bacterium]